MDQRHWERLEQLFHEGLTLPREDRSQFVRERGSEPPEIERELASLLANACVDLEEPLFGANSQEPIVIERYRLLEELLPRGGMGLVFRARRDDAQFEKEVALKLLRKELAGGDWQERFRRERQILASLDHPNIARLLDGGQTADGRPYLVMEYVSGTSIIDYCFRHELGVEARLELFLSVCDAVETAHRHLVIHRDLKPSNILVTAEGRPKLLDFGIAKVVGGPFRGLTLDETAAGFRVLTPEYASPEQLQGEPVQVTCDVFSLGVVLCEMLTGYRPFPLSSRSRGEAKLASKLVLGAVDDPRWTAGKPAREQWARRLRGDLDAIVGRAVELSPAKRYQNAGALADDLRRHLNRLPVAARKPTFSYRAQRFVSRHRVLVPVTAAVAAVLVLSLVVAIGQAVRARSAARNLEGLVHAWLLDLEPGTGNRDSSLVSRRLTLETAVRALEQIAADGGETGSAVGDLARGYEQLARIQGHPRFHNLGNLSDALASARRATELRRSLLAAVPGDEDRRLALASTLLLGAGILEASNETGEALSLAEEAERLSAEIGGEVMGRGFAVKAAASSQAGDLLRRAGRPNEARERLEAAMVAARNPWLSEPERKRIELATYGSLAKLAAQSGDWSKAADYSQQVAVLARELGSEADATSGDELLVVEGLLLFADYRNPFFGFFTLADPPASRRAYEEALAVATRAVKRDAADHWARVEQPRLEARQAMLDLGQGAPGARDALRSAVGSFRRLLATGEDYLRLAQHAAWALTALCSAERDDEAARAVGTCTELLELRQALVERDPASVPKRRDLAGTHSLMGELWVDLDRPDEGARQFEESYRLFRDIARHESTPGPVSETVVAICRWLRVSERAGKHAAAIAATNEVEALVSAFLSRPGSEASGVLARARQACATSPAGMAFFERLEPTLRALDPETEP